MGKVKEQFYRQRTTVGEVLKEEFMVPLKLSVRQCAKKVDVGAGTISRLVNGRCRISQPTAEKLGKAFGTSADFWMGFADNRTNPYPTQYSGW